MTRPRIPHPPSAARARGAALVLCAIAVLLPALIACDALRATSGPSRTPAPTSTGTPSPTVTPTATPTATPTPALPPNPDGLQRWPDVPIHYCIAGAGDGFVSADTFVAAVHNAFLAWGVATVDDGACAKVVDDDGVSQVGWDHLGNADAETSDVYEAGVTQTRYSECTRGCPSDDRISLVEADIRIDTTPPNRYRTERCLYSTVLHETGHFLGIGHLPAPAVMAAETSTCATTLTDADIDALRERYGGRAQPP